MNITVNGKNISVTEQTTLLTLLEKKSLSPDKVAIEHNGKIIPRQNFSITTLQNNDRVEIVHFVGGG